LSSIILLNPYHIFFLFPLSLSQVAKSGGIYGEKCVMHQCDKIPQAATGELTTSKNGIVQNPFKEGTKIISKTQKLACHFSYGEKRIEKLHKLANTIEGSEGKWPKLAIDHNGTRMAARGALLFSVARNIHGLKIYARAGNEDVAPWMENEWVVLMEIEAVLAVCCKSPWTPLPDQN
jgi:hypothetical protein